jgi:ADP-ribose pyrophosphatase YjhB (NUDIX family)
MPRFIRRVPEGDSLLRDVCATCGYVAYQNPKVVTGSVVVAPDGRVLLCRRAINPRVGFWTLPAGYMELDETVAEAAIREAEEEARAAIALDGILAVYSIARIGQVQVIWRARFARPGFAPGPETAEAALFGWPEIPWDELAFPSVAWALRAWRAAGPGPLGAPAGNPPEDPRGTAPLEGGV